MTTILNGLLGGLSIGLVAGVAVRIVDRDTSVPEAVLERTVGGRDGVSRWWGLAAQTVYGGLAGSTLLALELFALQILSVPPALGEALAVAVGWSALLFTVWALVRWIVPSFLSDRSSLLELLVYHVVYGLGLGLWIRVSWVT